MGRFIDEAIRRVEEIEPHGADWTLIDGAAVIRSLTFRREALGLYDKFPRWSVAYKFEAEEVTDTPRM
jgi:DNA ligase (NAD+)